MIFLILFAGSKKERKSRCGSEVSCSTRAFLTLVQFRKHRFNIALRSREANVFNDIFLLMLAAYNIQDSGIIISCATMNDPRHVSFDECNYH